MAASTTSSLPWRLFWLFLWQGRAHNCGMDFSAQISNLQVTGQMPGCLDLPKLRGWAKPGESSGSSQGVVNGGAWLLKWSEWFYCYYSEIKMTRIFPSMIICNDENNRSISLIPRPWRNDHRMTISVRHSRDQGRVDLGHKNLSKDGRETEFYVLTS